MPGQRKRKRKQQRRAEATRAATAGPGRWEVLFEAPDPRGFRAEMERLRAERPGLDPRRLCISRFHTIDPEHPDVIQVSLFTPDA